MSAVLIGCREYMTSADEFKLERPKMAHQARHGADFQNSFHSSPSKSLRLENRAGTVGVTNNLQQYLRLRFELCIDASTLPRNTYKQRLRQPADLSMRVRCFSPLLMIQRVFAYCGCFWKGVSKL
ncbi:hypothetical protein Y032_0777g2282 [Ancylostoma ceylanicum]|nr:hypothetical protein Y032_0777g2282 [Ancylostoma ceylanicum]